MNDLEKLYPNLFKGIGNIWLKLHIDESTQPAAQRPRRVPFHLRKKVELKELEQHGIIEKVDGRLGGFHLALVAVPKSN